MDYLIMVAVHLFATMGTAKYMPLVDIVSNVKRIINSIDKGVVTLFVICLGSV
jgi:hypothetical protein